MKVFKGMALFAFFLAAVLVTFLGRSALDEVRSDDGSQEAAVKKGRVRSRPAPYVRPTDTPTSPKKSKPGKLAAPSEFVSSPVALAPQSSFLAAFSAENGNPFCLEEAIGGIDPATILRLPFTRSVGAVTFKTVRAVYPSSRTVSPTK